MYDSSIYRCSRSLFPLLFLFGTVMSLVYHLPLLLYDLLFVLFVLSVLLGVCWTYGLGQDVFHITWLRTPFIYRASPTFILSCQLPYSRH